MDDDYDMPYCGECYGETFACATCAERREDILRDQLDTALAALAAARAEAAALRGVLAWVSSGEKTRNVTIYHYKGSGIKPTGDCLVTIYDEAEVHNVTGEPDDYKAPLMGSGDTPQAALAALAAKLEGG